MRNLKDLYKALRPLRIKMILEKWIHFMFISTIVSMGVGMGIIIVSKFILIQNIPAKLLFILFLLLITGSIALLFRIPNIEDVAEKGDSLGFKERFITAFEIFQTGGNSLGPMERIMVEDAICHAQNSNFRKNYPILFPRKKIKILGIMIIGVILTGFVPSPVKDRLKYELEVKQRIIEETKKVEKIQENLKKDTKLTPKQVKMLNEELEKLKSNLKKVKNEEDIIRTNQKATKELKKISKDSVQRELNKVGENLSKHESTRELGDKLQQGNIEEIKRALEKLNKEIKNFNEEQIHQLANGLKQAAKDLENNPSLKQALMDYEEALNSGNLNDLQKEYENLSRELENLALENKELRESIDKIRKYISNSSQGDDIQQESQEYNQNGNPEDGKGEGQGQGKGQGQSQGQSQGQGQGQGQGHIPNENIYKREATDKQDYKAQVDGEKNETGTIHQKDEKTIGKRGESIPYQEVYHEYKKNAIKFLGDDSIPYGIKDLVEEYFSSLE